MAFTQTSQALILIPIILGLTSYKITPLIFLQCLPHAHEHCSAKETSVKRLQTLLSPVICHAGKDKTMETVKDQLSRVRGGE